MCGIAGFCIADADLGRIDTAAMTAKLTDLMEHRGKDATGILTVSPRGRVELRKDNTAATPFLKCRPGIGRGAQLALIHTRAATQGTPKKHGNNHPIRYNDIIGVHNGVIHNDDVLFKEKPWFRYAEVDSEAIFAAIRHSATPTEALELLDGSYAVAWVDVATPKTLWLARGWSSPLHYARTTDGSIVFASTEHAVKAAMTAGGINLSAVDNKTFVTCAPQGFLACISPDDAKLETFPVFDYMGMNAPGGRPVRPVSSGYGYFGGEEWEHASGSFRGGQQANGPQSGRRTPSTPPASTPPNQELWSEKPPSYDAQIGVGTTHTVTRPQVGKIVERKTPTGWKIVEISGCEVVQKDDSTNDRQVPYLSAEGNTNGATKAAGDRVALTTRVGWSKTATITMEGTVRCATDGEYVVDWDETTIPADTPNIAVTSSFDLITGA